MVGKRRLDRRLGVLILAAGKGTRMESGLNKVLHPVAGHPMLSYVVESARQLKPEQIVIVVGHQEKQVKRAFPRWRDVAWVRQRDMLGTGHAVRSAAGAFRNFDGPILILYGDIPGVRVETLRRLAMVHTSSDSVITLLTAELDDPTGYGRIVLDPDGTVNRIVEEKDATNDEREIDEINTGIGMYESRFLFSAVRLLRPTNKQGELYLTDLVAAAHSAEKRVSRLRLKDPTETLGINDRAGLAEVSGLFFDEKAMELLTGGVTLEEPTLTFIEPQVEIGRDTVIEGTVYIRGNTRVGVGARIESGCQINGCEVGTAVRLGRNVSLRSVKVGAESVIGDNTVVGSSED